MTAVDAAQRIEERGLDFIFPPPTAFPSPTSTSHWPNSAESWQSQGLGKGHLQGKEEHVQRAGHSEMR